MNDYDLRDFSLFMYEECGKGRTSFFTDILPYLRTHNMTAMSLPEKWGGTDVSLTQLSELIAAEAKHLSGGALIHALHMIFSRAIMESDLSDTVKDEIAKAVVAGQTTNAYRVEPFNGSPSRGKLPVTIARRALNGWVIDGSKKFCSGSIQTGWIGVYAKTDEAEPRVGTFLIKNYKDVSTTNLVDIMAPAGGIKVIQTWQGPGLYSSMSDMLKFDLVYVPDEYAMNLRPASEPAQRSNPLRSAVLLSSIYNAVANSAFTHFKDWILFKELENHSRYIDAVGQISALLQTNEVMIKHFAKLDDWVKHDALELQPEKVSLLKYTCVTNARHVLSIIEPLIGSTAIESAYFSSCLADIICGATQTPATDQSLTAAGQYELTRKK